MLPPEVHEIESAPGILGNGGMGAAIAAHDWAATPLGPREAWPQSLGFAVGMIVASPIPMTLLWGSELVQIYNDGCRDLMGAKHPFALGQPNRVCWPETWEFSAPIYEAVLRGEARAFAGQKLTLRRNGRAEDAWFDLTYSPVADERGVVVGVLATVIETTARLLAEQRRDRDTEQQRRLFKRAPGFITILNGPDHRFEFANDAYVRLFGDRGYIGRTVREVFPDIAGQGFHELLDEVYSSGKRFIARAIPVRLQPTPDALFDDRLLDFVFEPIVDDEGVVTGLFVDGYDVTETHLAQEALRASEEFNRRVLESSTDCIKVLDLDGRVDFMSEGALCAMEVSDFDAVKGSCWPDFWTGEEHARALEAVETAKAGGTGRFQGFATTMKGTPRWWDVIVSPIAGADGRPQKLLSISRDVTATRRAEDRLRELNLALEDRIIERTGERDMLATIVATTDVMVMACDREYNILAINKASADEFERIYGLRPAAGDNMLALLADQPEHQAQMREGWGRGLAGEEVTFVESFGDPALDRPYYEIKFRPLLGPDSEHIGAYQFVTDITERLRREHQLSQAQDALRQSQKVEALGQLTGGIAHDFNNMLTIIRSSADLLRRREVSDDKRRRYIDAISDTADRAAKLTGQLLSFARRQALRPEVFDAGARVTGIADMLRTLLGSRIKLAIKTASDSCYVEADAAQFETAIVNMAVNARDAMDGEGELLVAVRSVAALPAVRAHKGVSGNFVAISVNDTGSGIAPEHLKRIFEPFFTTKAVGKGTGLGLSQLFGFAKQSGGEVDVTSIPGQGTTFTLYLPQADASQAPDASDRVRDSDVGRGRILVVEDNAEVGEFATQLLADLGYQTGLARDAGEALAKLEHDGQEFDLVFSDVVMPGISGVELGRRIRERWPSLPVVLTSGYSHVLAADARHGFALLHKPYSVENLSRTLKEAMAAPS